MLYPRHGPGVPYYYRVVMWRRLQFYQKQRNTYFTTLATLHWGLEQGTRGAPYTPKHGDGGKRVIVQRWNGGGMIGWYPPGPLPLEVRDLMGGTHQRGHPTQTTEFKV